jgi:DNA-binding GntR family transcriptional regulator
MAIEKIINETLRQKVYEQLRARILDAQLTPGEVINLRGIAAEYGVSLLPVREAIWQLESERVLVVESNKKIRVNHLTVSEFDEVLHLRLLLESEAIEKACRLRPQAAVPKLQRILEAMEKQIGTNFKAYIKKNDQFHQTIYSYAGSALLLELIQRLLARVNPYVYLYAIENKDLTAPSDCHRKMFEGFAEGDGAKAVEALKRDLNHAASYILPHLEK